MSQANQCGLVFAERRKSNVMLCVLAQHIPDKQCSVSCTGLGVLTVTVWCILFWDRISHIKEVLGCDIMNVTVGCAVYKVGLSQMKQCVVVCTRFGLHEDKNMIWSTLSHDATDTAIWYGLCKIGRTWL